MGHTKRNLLLAVTVLSLCFTTKANNDIEKLKKQALTELASERYQNAKELLTQIVVEDPHDAWFHYGLGVSCLHTSSFELAVHHLKKAYEINPTKGVDKAYRYWLGKAYHQNHQFDLAIQEYTSYEQSLRKSDKARNEIQTLIKQATVGSQLVSNAKQTLIVPFDNGTNSPYDDHSPIIGNNGSTVYYTSKIKLHPEAPQDKKGDFYETVFVTHKNEMGKWSIPQSIRKRNNEVHESSIQLFDNDQKMLAYKGEKKGKIHILKKDPHNNWFVADQLIEINSFGTDGHATVSDDGNTIIFSKKNNWLRQDTDLYISSRNEDGNWTKPELLSEEINTAFDEASPFLSSDGKQLFFSSNNEKSMGGFDIFKTSLQPDGSWSVPVNLGHPINTAHHDLYYQENKDKTIATFASHREEGKGQLDIYMAYNVQMVNISGTVSTSDLTETQDLAVYFNSVGDLQHPFSAQATIAENGTFEKQLVSNNSYRVFVTQGNQVIKEEVIEVEKSLVKGKSIKYEILLTNPKNEETIEEELSLEEIGNYLDEGYSISIVLFDYNKSELNSTSKDILDIVYNELNTDSSLKVELIGHTDNIGSVNYNHLLSKQRAEMAASYLKQNGIDANRIITEAKGKKEPINSNQSEAERAKNRRLEINLFNE